MAAEARISDADREQVIDYIGNEVRSLHEGNAIRAEVCHSSILTGPASVIGSRSTTRRPLGQLRWRGDAAPVWLVARYW